MARNRKGAGPARRNGEHAKRVAAATPRKRLVGLRRAIFIAVMSVETRTRFQRMLLRWVGGAIAGVELFGMVVMFMVFGALFDALNSLLSAAGWNPFEPFVVYIMRVSGTLVFGMKVAFSMYEEYLVSKRETNELEKGVTNAHSD